VIECIFVRIVVLYVIYLTNLDNVVFFEYIYTDCLPLIAAGCFPLVLTPDAASELLEDVDSKVQQRANSSLVQGTPVYGPRTLQRTMDSARLIHAYVLIVLNYCCLITAVPALNVCI